MQRLNNQTYAKIAAPDGPDSYDRTSIHAGVLHFGIGNFHRSHQAVYFHKLLLQGYKDWGITAVSLRSSSMRDQLAPQDQLYSEVTLDREVRLRIIGSVLNILVAPEDPGAVIERLSDGRIKLVTATITEKGYCLTDGELNRQHPDLIADHTSLERPQTIYGYLAAGIIARSSYSDKALTVLCCDNILKGGQRLRAGVLWLLRRHDRRSLAWAENNVSFASSMVDRVSPATNDDLRELVSSRLGLEDASPVSAEPFTQWAIEDNFAAERPPLEQVGAVFTDEVQTFEVMKLRILNAGHSLIAVLGYLAGVESVHEALQQAELLTFTRAALLVDVVPVVRVPEGVEARQYVADVLVRFENASLPYAVQQVNTDSSQKLQLRWFPTIDEALDADLDTRHLNFGLAAWLVYVEKALKANELNDPLAGEFSTALAAGGDTVAAFLHCAGAKRFEFPNNESFMQALTENYALLKNTDLSSAVTAFLSTREEQSHA